MAVLITFIPWLTYWIFLSFGRVYLAVWLALIAALVLNLDEMRRRKSKILTLGTGLFFLLMVILTTATGPAAYWHQISLMGNLALALITLVSLLIRKPFTIQYAMETVPKERWHTPEFLHSNMVITSGWLIAFMCMAVPSAGGLFGYEAPIWFNWVFSLLCFVGASVFTAWYKKKIRKAREARSAKTGG